MDSVQNQNKKKQERLIIDKFRQVFMEFPKGKLISSESPDFILRTSPKQSFGIELMRLITDKKSEMTIYDDLDKAMCSKEEKLTLYKKKRLNRYWLLLYGNEIPKLSHFDVEQLRSRAAGSAYHKIFLMLVPENKIIHIK